MKMNNDYAFRMNENGTIEIIVKNNIIGKVTDFPHQTASELEKVVEIYLNVFGCLSCKDVAYIDLINFNEKYSKCQIKRDKDVIAILSDDNLVAVITDVKDEDISMDLFVQLVFMNYFNRDFMPFFATFDEFYN